MGISTEELVRRSPKPRFPRPDSDFRCKDCGCEYWAYMAKNSVWVAAGLHYYENVCQACLSKRLNRPLTMDDYRLCPLNMMNVDGFNTEDNWRKLYAQDGMDYDKEKAAYFERCKQLGLEPNWGSRR